jgi:hypothetical protein
MSNLQLRHCAIPYSKRRATLESFNVHYSRTLARQCLLRKGHRIEESDWIRLSADNTSVRRAGSCRAEQILLRVGPLVTGALRNQIIFSKALGKADLEQDVPVATVSIHRLGSISKPVSSAYRARDILLLGGPWPNLCGGAGLPTIVLTGRLLTKTRGGKRGQITPMIRFVRELPAARGTTGPVIRKSSISPTPVV